MKVSVTVEVEVPDEDTASSWMASMIDMSRPCHKCGSKGYIGSILDQKACGRCDGRGQLPEPHPYQPVITKTAVVRK